jgi:hypothetical protein
MNSASLQAIEDSIFVMCLDKMSKVEDNATASSRVALQLLHGYGADNNSGNRWFDKTLQVNYFVYSYRVLNMKNNSPVNICSLLLVKMG